LIATARALRERETREQFIPVTFQSLRSQQNLLTTSPRSVSFGSFERVRGKRFQSDADCEISSTVIKKRRANNFFSLSSNWNFTKHKRIRGEEIRICGGNLIQHSSGEGGASQHKMVVHFSVFAKKKERKEKEKMLIVSEPSRREIQLKNTERMEDVKDSEKVPENDSRHT
jgi:hypothetical protein